MPQQKNPKTKKAALSTQQILNIRQFVPLHVNGDAYAIEGEDGCTFILCFARITFRCLAEEKFFQKSETSKT